MRIERCNQFSNRTTFKRESTGVIRLAIASPVLALRLPHSPPSPPPGFPPAALASLDGSGYKSVQ
ncbi:hypothetical protein PENSPDRAFT_660141 [Peniophora sp. CONT]|nr:hypothetical protein PENSPDRAFT_660141 [Peniophora sp. CONT]